MGELELLTGSVSVRVPATSANIGPGYDSFGLALSLYDDVVGRVTDGPGVSVEVRGEGADDVPRDDTHLVVRAAFAAFEAMGVRPRGLDVLCTNRIPHGRGLGSSAAAVVAGVSLARGLVRDGTGRLDARATLQLASELEGHPDNAAAALFGGFTVSWTGTDDDGALDVGAVPLPVATSVIPVVCVPSWQLSTHSARGLMPSTVPHHDAAVNVSRAALLVTALAAEPGRTDLLLTATQDRLHQAYRAPAYAATYDLVRRLRAEGLAAVVSGAGPSVLVLTDAAGAGRVGPLAGEDFTATVLAVDADGVRIQTRPS